MPTLISQAFAVALLGACLGCDLGEYARPGPSAECFIGAPRPDTELRAGDRLILYGRTPRIAELDARSSDATGDQRHAEAVEQQAEIQQIDRTSASRLPTA